MAEIRQDVISGRWVIIATERGARPSDFASAREKPQGGFCPFCTGNEERTPPEVDAMRRDGSAPDRPGWQVRVVPNKFPALRPEGQVLAGSEGLHNRVSGVGVHEVIIDAPHHAVSPTELLPSEFAAVLGMYRARMKALCNDERMTYGVLFKNVGAAAGASLEHGHSQLIGVPVMPRRVQEEMQHCRVHYDTAGRCLLCDILAQELADGARVVVEGERFVAICPYAPRFPFEMSVLPKYHSARFHETPTEHLDELASVLHEALRRMEASLDNPPFNFALHTAPLAGPAPEFYHWHIEVIPRVTRAGGFEWGTGFYINPMPPENAAQSMREQN